MEYLAISFAQRKNVEAPKYCLFEAPVKDVISWSNIPRLSPKLKDGIQRPLKDNKVKAIKSFLESNLKNTIPTAVVITFPENAFEIVDAGGVGSSIVKFNVNPEEKDNIFVVDGQHRIYGLNAFDEESRVPIVAILNADNQERAFQFIVVNNKVSKVPADHIRALVLNSTKIEDEEGLDKRLKVARLSLSRNLDYVGFANESEDSPFKGIVAFPNVPESDRRVVPAAIESSIAYIQSKNIRELSSDDSAYDFFLNIWGSIKDKWKRAFPDEEKLMSKVGVVCMTMYLTDAINLFASWPESQIDFNDSESISLAADKLLASLSEDFWLSEWELRISDTRSVRDHIMDSLETISMNHRNNQEWSKDISFIK